VQESERGREPKIEREGGCGGEEGESMNKSESESESERE